MLNPRSQESTSFSLEGVPSRKPTLAVKHIFQTHIGGGNIFRFAGILSGYMTVPCGTLPPHSNRG